MSTKNGVWHDARLDPPRPNQGAMLVIREIGKGAAAYRKYDFGIYTSSMDSPSSLRMDGTWNKGGVIFWMPLPKMPEVE